MSERSRLVKNELNEENMEWVLSNEFVTDKTILRIFNECGRDWGKVNKAISEMAEDKLVKKIEESLEYLRREERLLKKLGKGLSERRLKELAEEVDKK